MIQDRRLAAIMFTDIVGYTVLMGRDENQAFQLLRKNRKIQRPLIEKYRGEWLKEMGDGILASFSSASDAVRCASEIQEAAKNESIALRIGIHEGEVVFEGGDVFGEGVNIASRLEEVAGEGEIIISGAVNREIKNKAGFNTAFVDEKMLKGVDEPTKIYKLLNENEEYVPGIGVSKKRRIKPIVWALLTFLFIVSAVVLWSDFVQKEDITLDKSIAVLPLEYLSEDPSKQYLADGVMDVITGHLSKIEGLRVTPRTSVEQYRETTKPAKLIGEELDVSYLIEGSFFMIDNRVRLTIQLVTAKDEDNVLYKEYDRDWEDIFEVQSEVAQTIAKEVEIVITPEVKERIESMPTASLTAYDFFLRARNEHTNYWLDNNDKGSLEKAIALYRTALENDTTYALAYTGLALAYLDKHFWPTFFEEDFLDSTLVLANKALNYNGQLEEAYYVRGIYYVEATNDYSKALKDLDKALQINPSYSKAYFEKARINFEPFGDYVDGIQNLHKAVALDHSLNLPLILSNLSSAYMNIGFSDEAVFYEKEALKLDGDSSRYFNRLSHIEFIKGNLKGFLEQSKRGFTYDSTSKPISSVTISAGNLVTMVHAYSFLGNHQQEYIYAKKLLESAKTEEILNLDETHRIGYAFWQVGKKQEGEYYLNIQIDHCLKSIKLDRGYAKKKYAYYDLAAIYAFIGEREKAFQLLGEVDKRNCYPLLFVRLFKHDPMFNSIRDDNRFQQIMRNIESTYQKEHERVRVWLEEEGLLL